MNEYTHTYSIFVFMHCVVCVSRTCAALCRVCESYMCCRDTHYIIGYIHDAEGIYKLFWACVCKCQATFSLKTRKNMPGDLEKKKKETEKKCQATWRAAYTHVLNDFVCLHMSGGPCERRAVHLITSRRRCVCMCQKRPNI